MVRAATLALGLLSAPCVMAGTLTEADRTRLEQLVVQDCGSCHGLKLTGGLGSPITQEALDGHTVEGLRGIILDGVPGTAMPPWRPLLTEQEATWIAVYLLENAE